MDRDRRGAARTAPKYRPLAFWSVATVFLVVMTGTTLPSPLFGIYEQRLHISSLSVTVIYSSVRRRAACLTTGQRTSVSCRVRRPAPRE